VDFYERRGFGGVRDEGLFDQDVLSGAKGPDCPFVVEAVGERDVDCVYGGVIEEGWSGVTILRCTNKGK
jgi:hypothetical protein